jgi:hypothetical protein
MSRRSISFFRPQATRAEAISIVSPPTVDHSVAEMEDRAFGRGLVLAQKSELRPESKSPRKNQRVTILVPQEEEMMIDTKQASVSRINVAGARWLLFFLLLSVAVWSAIIWYVTNGS